MQIKIVSKAKLRNKLLERYAEYDVVSHVHTIADISNMFSGRNAIH